MLTPNLLPDGQMFMASDRMILAEKIETMATKGFKIGDARPEYAIHATVTGRLNNSEEPADVTFAVSPQDAMALVDMIMTSVEAITLAKAGDDQ